MNLKDGIDKLVAESEPKSIYFGDSPLWTAAANGDKKYLEKYYKNGGKANQRFNGFGNEHSLIMAAARNQLPEIVKLLEGYGETTMSPYEANELSLLKNQWGLESPEYQSTEVVDPNYNWKEGGYKSYDQYVSNISALDNIYKTVFNRQKEYDTNDLNYRNKKISIDDWIANQKSIYDKYQLDMDNYYKLLKK